MKRNAGALLAVSVLALSTVALVAPAGAADGGRPITVEMTGAAERPGPGDPDGTGTAAFRINPGLARVCYTLTVADVATPTAAHIHRAPNDAPGPVVVPLTAPAEGTASGCAAITRALALELIQDPAAFYVNVHNAEFPAGAVRGQLG